LRCAGFGGRLTSGAAACTAAAGGSDATVASPAVGSICGVPLFQAVIFLR
jgi:hypothetical protein